MSTTAIKCTQPIDARDEVIQRAMGSPLVVADVVLVSATYFVDIFDFSAVSKKNRVFTSMAVRNLSSTSTVEIAFGEAFADERNIICGTQEFMILDQLMFGPSVRDEITGTFTTRIRARLGTAQGSPATGTIVYADNPSDAERVVINGIKYEFSNDLSISPTLSDYGVQIGATADDTWNSLVTAINAADQAVRASINTGTNTVTITSVAGGAAADAITIADGVPATGETFSGATLTGSAGGVTPVIHIW